MRPEVPWNVAGIPSEAREAARAAARREGLSVGEWMTRRILQNQSVDDVDHPENDDARSAQDPSIVSALPRDTEEMLERVSRSESETASASRRTEEQIRSMARRLDAAERSQTENSRVMSKAALEMNITAREQAQSFDQLGTAVTKLADRLNRLEHTAGHENLKEAVKGLHQGLTRLADQISDNSNQSAFQISSLADNLESVAARLGQARHDAEAHTQSVDTRLDQIDGRIRTAEKAMESAHVGLEHTLASLNSVQRLEERLGRVESAHENDHAIARLEQSVAALETRISEPAIDQRLNGIERTLSDIVARFDNHAAPAAVPAAVETSIKILAERLDFGAEHQREAIAELRAKIAALEGHRAPEPFAAPPAFAIPEFAPELKQSSPVEFDAPPFADVGSAPPNAPPFSDASFANPSFANPSFANPSFANPSFANPADAFAPPPPLAFETAGAFPAETFPGQTIPSETFPGETFRVDPNQFVAEPAHTQGAQGESFLAAARRSAQAAAALAETERGAQGFAWGTRAGDRAHPNRMRLSLIGLLALVVILAIVAGVMFSQRPGNGLGRASSLSALFAPKTPSTLKPAAGSGDTIAPPPAAAAPASVSARSNAAPALQAGRLEAPSSPVLAPAKPLPVRTAAVHGVPESNTPTSNTPSSKAPSQTASQNSSLNPVQVAAPNAPGQTPRPGVAASSLSALDHATQLANAGNPKAETAIGIRYLDGDGVPVNETEGAKWLERAANHGVPVAQYRLGTLYERGKGLAADPAKALHWYLAAAQSGNRKAMHNLAVAYAQGSGTAKDFSEAARWFSKAANLGLADSQFNLAVLYERGLGVPQSLLDAFKWYAIAASQGDAESKSRIDAIATQLSADDRSAAQKSADLFRPLPLDAAANVPPTLNDVAAH